MISLFNIAYMTLKQIDNQKLINKVYQPLNEDDKKN